VAVYIGFKETSGYDYAIAGVAIEQLRIFGMHSLKRNTDRTQSTISGLHSGTLQIFNHKVCFG